MTPPAARYYFFNDRIVDASEPTMLLQDLGLFRGYAVFDYMRTSGGKPLLLEQYLQRFRHSAEALRLTLHLPDAELSRVIHELIDRNRLAESGVRLLLTGGYSPDTLTPAEPNLIIRVEASKPAPETYYTEGAALVTDEYLRDWPQVKHTNYLNAIRNQPRILAAGAVEVLYHWHGEVLECSRSNIFAVKRGRLLTPPATRVLAGVTRAGVIRLAGEAGIGVDEAPLKLEELLHADEVFITGTTKRIMPIVKIDYQNIGSGNVGPLSKHLLELWMQQVEQ